jgi:hypothetical protein
VIGITHELQRAAARPYAFWSSSAMLGCMHPHFHPLLALVLPLILADPVAAAPSTPATAPRLALSDAELAARLDFLQERLDAGRASALAWQWGWTAVYTTSFALNFAQAVQADDGDDRVRAIVDAAKSGLATVQTVTLLRDPLAASLGGQPMRDVPGDDRPARLERLALGERQLLTSATRAETRYSLRRHAVTIGANLLGGAAIYALGDAGDAVRSTLIGLAVGEAQIWSQPWRATADLREYRENFSDMAVGAREPRARGTGIRLALRF